MFKWFTYRWWYYLLKNNTGIRNIICRAKGHPSGPWYYNSCGIEPDYRCQDCEEDLG